jgi:hypothetical protein
MAGLRKIPRLQWREQELFDGVIPTSWLRVYCQ